MRMSGVVTRWLAAVIGVGLLAGCGGGGGRSASENAVLTRVRQLTGVWEANNPGQLGQFYRDGVELYSYWFDGEDKPTHLVTLSNLMAGLRNWQLTAYDVQMTTINGTRVGVASIDFVSQFYSDISAMDQTTSIYDWVNGAGRIRQIWVYDGSTREWVVAEEYFSRLWLLAELPLISPLTISPDIVAPGASFSLYGETAASTSYWVTVIPECSAGELFTPEFTQDWGPVVYDGSIRTATGAIGGYSVTLWCQADPAVGTTMVGRSLRADVVGVEAQLTGARGSLAVLPRKARLNMKDLATKKPQRAGLSLPPRPPR